MSRYTGKIGILGAGALGALYGARIAKAGYDVHFLARSDYDAVKASGYQIKSFQGDFNLEAQVYKTSQDMGPVDLLIVGLKVTSNHVFMKVLKDLVHDDTVILTLQNGLGNEEAIEEALQKTTDLKEPKSHIVGGVAFLCSNRIAPGVIHHLEYGHLRLAEFDGTEKERTETIAQLFRDAEFDCNVHDSLMHIRWEKLVWNIPYNGMGVGAWKADTEQIMKNAELRENVRSMMCEVIAAAKSDSVQLKEALVEKMMKYTDDMGAYKSSMQLDFEEGRPLETEAILGEPVRRARKADIPVPRMEFLYAVVKRLDKLNQDQKL